MIEMTDILETIRARRSVRTYRGNPLTANQKAELTAAIASAVNPFGGEVAIRLADVDIAGPYRPGTYGVIRGARNYLLMGMADDDRSQLAAGFMMEQVVLRATALGLGTCWIAATFKGSDFARLAQMPDGLSLRIVSPVGEPAEKKSLLERLTRTVARSSTRKPFGDLFFVDDFSTPLQSDSKFGLPLEMLRLAPSSTNSQPWRALVEGDTVHFFCRPGSCALIDLGIGLSHFALTCDRLNLSGDWQRLPQPPTPAHASLRYVISYAVG